MISFPARMRMAHDIHAQVRILFVSILSPSNIWRIPIIQILAVRKKRIIGRNRRMMTFSTALECLISRKMRFTILAIRAMIQIFFKTRYMVSIRWSDDGDHQSILIRFEYTTIVLARSIPQTNILNRYVEREERWFMVIPYNISKFFANSQVQIIAFLTKIHIFCSCISDFGDFLVRVWND